MVSHRLARLARLTQGVALVGIGVAQAACTDKPAAQPNPELVHINAPPSPTLDPASADASLGIDATATDSEAPAAAVFDAGARRHGPHVNAPPGTRPQPNVNSPPPSTP